MRSTSICNSQIDTQFKILVYSNVQFTKMYNLQVKILYKTNIVQKPTVLTRHWKNGALNCHKAAHFIYSTRLVYEKVSTPVLERVNTNALVQYKRTICFKTDQMRKYILALIRRTPVCLNTKCCFVKFSRCAFINCSNLGGVINEMSERKINQF